MLKKLSVFTVILSVSVSLFVFSEAIPGDAMCYAYAECEAGYVDDWAIENPVTEGWICFAIHSDDPNRIIAGVMDLENNIESLDWKACYTQ